MTLYIAGLGINDEKDISIKAIEVLRECDEVYCELFTNKWDGDIKNLESLTNKKITILSRAQTESEFLIKMAENKKICLLVPGDPLAATTHFSLFQEALKRNIETKVIHSSSIFTAVAETGLHLYKFGRTVTLCSPKKNYDPKSPFHMIEENAKQGLHTLILLDVDSESGKYMSVKEAAEMLIYHDKKYEETKIIAVCCLGGEKQKIKYAKTEKIKTEKFTEPAVLIIPGALHFTEEEALELWK